MVGECEVQAISYSSEWLEGKGMMTVEVTGLFHSLYSRQHLGLYIYKE